ncbi:hypothetical protein BG003_002501 [Podila horticola]|nr:hypothetical protein BG003_002501 [Podila horticola]
MNTSIVRSDNHNKYGSTGTTPITTAQYTIFILHNGQSTSQAFSAKALSTETVDDLKKLIKIVRSPALDRIPADKLKLVRVDIPDDPATESRPVCFQHLAIVRPLRATELLRDVFPEPPEQGKIHVVIESAEPVASSAVMTPRAHVRLRGILGQALSTDTVDELKKLIKAAKARCSTVTLIGVSIPDDPSKEHEKICLKHLAYTRPLRATEVLEDFFLSRLPERGRIHVVIETDEPKSARPDAPAETNDLPYPVLPSTTSNPISSYPALPVATPSSTNTEETLSYPLESLDVIEPLSNPLPLDPSTTLTLFCLVDGQSTKQTWSIKALPADTVDDLKKAVKAAQAPNFDHVAAGELHLRKVNIENDPESDTVPVNIKNVKYRELKPMDTVAEIYPQGTERKVVQLVVMKPVPKPDVGRGESRTCGICGSALTMLAMIGIPVLFFFMVIGPR